MRILEFMSFNPSWFLTLPGILITSGVILLLIALILLLTSTKKEEEEEIASQEVESYKPIVEDELSVEPLEIKVPTVADAVAVAVADADVTPSMAVKNEEIVMPIKEEMTVEQPQINNVGILDIASNNVNVEKTENVETLVLNNEGLSENVGVLNINSNNLNQVNNVVEPATSNVTMDSIEENVVIKNAEEPVFNIPNIETTPVVDTIPSVSIYGGVNPTLDIHKSDFEPEKPVIYGGADPLENTAPIPTVPRQAYSASTPQVNVNPIPVPVTPTTEVKLVDPIAQPTEITPSAIVDTSINDTISAGSVSEEAIETLEI